MKNVHNPRSCAGLARLGVPAALLGALLLLGACASTPAPTEQMAVTGAAVSSATSAGAPELAPAEMQTARDKFERAKTAMTKEDYDSARRLAEEAQVDAQLAEAKARSEQARKASDELQRGIRVLREELERKSK